MSSHLALLFAAFDPFDFIKAIIPIVLLVIWVVSQVMGAKVKGQPARKVPQARARPNAPPADRVGGEFANEIEDFLKKAAQRREGQKPMAAEAAKPARPPVAAKARRESAEARKRGAAPPVAQLVRPRDKKSLRETSASPQEADARALAAREASLSSLQPGQAISSHLSQVFDHNVGTLSDRHLTDHLGPRSPGAAEKQAAASALTSLAVLLTTPQSLQQAIIVNEILQRPEHRW